MCSRLRQTIVDDAPSSEGGEMGGREMAEAVLDPVQVLDQQVALARRDAEELLHLEQRLRVDAAALGRTALSLPRRRLRRDRDDGS